MTRSNIQHDVVQLLDKYKIAEILNTLTDIMTDDNVKQMRTWFLNSGFVGDKREIGDDLDDELIKSGLHEIDHINIKIAKLERGQEYVMNRLQPPNKEVPSPVQTTGAVPKEIIDVINSYLLSDEDTQRLLDYLKRGEK